LTKKTTENTNRINKIHEESDYTKTRITILETNLENIEKGVSKCESGIKDLNESTDKDMTEMRSNQTARHIELITLIGELKGEVRAARRDP